MLKELLVSSSCKHACTTEGPHTGHFIGTPTDNVTVIIIGYNVLFASVQVLCILDMYRYLKKLLISNVIILCIFNALYIGIATHTQTSKMLFKLT